MLRTETKKKVITEYKSQLQKELDGLKGTIEKAKERMIDAPGAMQSHHDTTKVETGWLIDGLAKKLETVESAIQIIARFETADETGQADCVTIGSLVVLKSKDEELTYFLLPNGEGRKMQVEGREVVVISPYTPIGRLLIGRMIEESLFFRKKDFEVFEIL